VSSGSAGIAVVDIARRRVSYLPIAIPDFQYLSCTTNDAEAR
jgi:hypothetical protein